MRDIRVWTIGHSTRSAQAFLSVLHVYGIEAVADVRRFPGSRRHPQFGMDALSGSLDAHRIAYHWIPKLGGRRRVQQQSGASAWRNPSFHAYAEYMRSEEFAEGLDDLLHMAAAARTAMMCSELLWWRCHRALISDVLLSMGFEVTHILGETESRPHAYTSPARIVEGELCYPVDAAPPQPRVPASCRQVPS